MAGPSLRQLHAHRSIHEGAYVEARDGLELLEKLRRFGRGEQAREAANLLVEHWETRTLAHAQAEEEGFYQEQAAQKPELAETVTMLRRDHALMRILVDEIKQILPAEGVTEAVVDRFKALMLIVSIHSREEESLLF